MKKLAKLLSLVLAVIMCASLVVACGNKTQTTTAAPVAETTAAAGETTAPADVYRELKVGSNDPKCIGHFDTTCAFDANYNGYSMDIVFDQMMFKNAETGDYDSYILTDWHWDDELCAAVITLRDDIYFSNGDQMKGEDIVYTFKRMASSFMNADMGTIIDLDNMTVSDDGLTVYIKYFKPYGPWRYYLCGNTAVHNKSFEEDEIGLDNINFNNPEHVCGSGPYKVTEYVVDNYTVFEKRDDWWMEGKQAEDNAAWDKITVTSYSDTTTMMVDYEMGALDVAFGISSSDYDRISADPSLGAAGLNPTNFVSMLSLNTGSSPFADKNLRLAFAYGCDWEQITKLAYGSLGKVAQSSLPSDCFAFKSGYTYEYNPEKAQKLIDDNNLGGTELSIVCTPDVASVIAEMVQGMMTQYGITINIDVRDMATCAGIWMQPGTTAWQLDAAAFSNLGNDPHHQYRTLMATGTFPNITQQDEKLNELLNKGCYTTDDAQRKAAYEEFQAYLYEEAFALPIAEWYSAFCYNTDTVAYMAPLDLSMPQLRTAIPAK